jgi:cell division septation protein DedD
MAIETDGSYRDGAIYPSQPLPLPENTPVRVVVVPKTTASVAPPSPFPTTREEILAIRPQSPRITPEEFDALIEKYSISVGSLPPDFSRADIYSEHD